MELGDFHDYIESVLNVGDTADDFIIPCTRQAARMLERNYSFKYMEIFQTGLTLSEGESSYVLTSGTKSLHFVRFALDDGTYQYAEQADPRNFETPDEACPTHFYWSGELTLRFNNEADEDYDLELHRISYTTWPTGLTEEPWLLANAEDLMVAQTLMQLAVPLKDPDLLTLNKTFRDEALRTVVSADLEARASAENPEMLFG